MSEPVIQYAGGSDLELFYRSRQGVLARAPQWVRELAARGTQPGTGSATLEPLAKQTPVRTPVRSSQRYIGWVAGVVAPGVSVPAFAAVDGEHLPEQFTFRCWESMLSQLKQRQDVASLQWGHGGPVLARGPVDLKWRKHAHEMLGLCFEARLADNELSRQVLESIKADGLGVSIGYITRKHWHVERDGIGRMRVVDDVKVDHVALLPADGRLRPCFPAARAYGERGDRATCPRPLRDRAEVYAWREIKRQLGINS